MKMINSRNALPFFWPDRKQWISEFRFHPTRKWRFDFALLEKKIAIEVNGGVWIRGRHTRGAGQIADMEKLNAAQALGWRVFQFTPSQMKSGQAMRFIAGLDQKEVA